MRKFVSTFFALCLCICVLGNDFHVKASEPESTSTSESSTDSENQAGITMPSLSRKLSSSKTVTLSWKSENDGTTYTLSRATSKTGTYKSIASIKSVTGTQSYKDKNLSLGKTYYYKLSLVADDASYHESNVISVKVRLLAPSSVTTSVDTSNDVTLSWKKVSNASGYTIYRSTSQSGSYTKLKSTTKTSYKDTTPGNAKAYYYKIYAYCTGNSAAKSAASTIVAAYTKPAKPTISSAKYSSGAVKLTWKKITRATIYYIYRLNSDGTYKQIGTSQTCSFKDSSVKKNVRYKYKIKAAYKADNKTVKSSYSTLLSIYTAKIDPGKPMVALTFDDGPGPYTQAIVDCLKKNDARATFFVVGNRVDSYKSALKSAYTNGNEIANHTYSHPTLTKLGTSSVKSQISKTDSAVKKVTGEATTLVRAPSGATNSSVRNAIDKPFIYWSIDTLDWKHRNKQTTINTVMKNVKDGDIILMHDIHKPSKEAALELIPKLKKAGYQLVTVDELAEYQGYKMKNHTTYYSFR